MSASAPQCARAISGDGQRIAAVDDHVAFGVTDQEERHRDLDTVERERAAVEQIELEGPRHEPILMAGPNPRRPVSAGISRRAPRRTVLNAGGNGVNAFA